MEPKAIRPGLIDHMIVSMFLNNKNKKSIVKFGSFDSIGLLNGKELKMMKTKSVSSWDI